MTTTQQNASGGGLFSKLVVVLLLALAIGLYLRIVMVEAEAPVQAVSSQVSVPVVEETPATPVTPAPAVADNDLKPLPDAQMDTVRRVFAPELAE